MLSLSYIYIHLYSPNKVAVSKYEGIYLWLQGNFFTTNLNVNFVLP